ncbi:hypothetical protein ACFQ60_07750 [Streptomyces zhihengii]
MTFLPMPVHSWNVTSSSMPGCSFSNVSVKRFSQSSETLFCMSQMLTVRVSEPPGIRPHPPRASEQASTVDRAR